MTSELFWREKEPKDWNCDDYVSYIKDTGIDNFYFNFFNVMERVSNKRDGKMGEYMSLGFRCPSIDLSRVWAMEQKFLFHRCKIHNLKHSELETGREFPTATWRCPEGEISKISNKSIGITQIPHRYDYSKGNYIPITFFLNDYSKGKELIWSIGRKARIWHTEMSIFSNKFRDSSIFPDKILDKWDDKGRAEKLERVVGCSLRLEFDTTKEKIGDVNGVPKYGRRDFMEEGDKVIENAQKIIDFMNEEMYSRFGFGIDDFEWWFSGDGLYLITRRGLYCEDVRINNKVWKNWSGHRFYNHIWNYWNYYSIRLKKDITDSDYDIRYINIDYKTQFLRSYIKVPFSLHRKYDRVTLPLTSMFKGNNQIDLNLSWWRKFIMTENITRNFVEKTGSKVNING